MVDDGSDGNLQRWVSLATTVIAPATVLGALLFYFGYVSSRAQFAYFGVDVDTIGLTTQDYVMRSPQPLLVPLLVLTLVGVGAIALHAWIRQRIGGARSDTPGPAHLNAYRRVAHRVLLGGLALMAGGVVLLFAYASLRDWAWYGLVTPLLLAGGATLVAYAARLQHLLHPPASTEPDTTPDAARAHADNSVHALRRSATVLLVVVIVANVFWITATVAQYSGRGQAHALAKRLDTLPNVILDTRERLYLRDPGVEETALPISPGQTFHYRYRHLRLLIQGHGLMFLVPDTWSASDSTLVVPLDESVRVQFQFENQTP